MIKRLFNFLLRHLRTRQPTPRGTAAQDVVRSGKHSLVRLNMDEWSPDAQQVLRSAATEHASLTFYDGKVQHGYALSAVPTPERCPRCHADTRQHYANFIYATQAAPRVIFAPAGYFCMQCPTVVIDEAMIRAGITYDLQELDRVGRDVPVLLDLKPAGNNFMEDFHVGGSLPSLWRRLKDHLDLNAKTVNGETIGEIIARWPAYVDDKIIRPLDNPLVKSEAIAILTGNLAPGGAAIKLASATPALFQHEGPAHILGGREFNPITLEPFEPLRFNPEIVDSNTKEVELKLPCGITRFGCSRSCSLVSERDRRQGNSCPGGIR